MAERKRILRAEPLAARMVEDIVGCKWSLAVLDAVAALEREREAERAVSA